MCRFCTHRIASTRHSLAHSLTRSLASPPGALLLHPSHHVLKTYVAHLAHNNPLCDGGGDGLLPDASERFEQGTTSPPMEPSASEPATLELPPTHSLKTLTQKTWILACLLTCLLACLLLLARHRSRRRHRLRAGHPRGPPDRRKLRVHGAACSIPLHSTPLRPVCGECQFPLHSTPLRSVCGDPRRQLRRLHAGTREDPRRQVPPGVKRIRCEAHSSWCDAHSS